jgi:hypothetical protein
MGTFELNRAPLRRGVNAPLPSVLCGDCPLIIPRSGIVIELRRAGATAVRTEI